MSKLFHFLKNHSIAFFILFLMVIGLFLRTYYLNQNHILFGYDQARDAYIAQQIIQGDLKILGPPVSFGGLYHGVLYYYFISIPYFLSHGNPLLPIFFISLLNILAIPLVYFIGKKFFDQKTGILAAIFYTVSFDVIQYSNWLSNPSLAIPFSILLYCGLLLFLFTDKKNLGIVLTALGYGLCFQSEFFLGYLILPIIFLFLYFKKNITKKQCFLFLAVSLLTISTMIVSSIKFGGNTYSGLNNLFSNNNQFAATEVDFSIDLKMFFVRLIENFYRTVFPFKSLFTFILVIFCFYFFINKIKEHRQISKPLFVFWVFLISQIIIIPFGGDHIPYFNSGFQIPAIFIVSSYIVNFSKNKFVPILFSAFLITFSLIADFKYNPKIQILNDIPKAMTLKNQIEAIDYTYQDSSGQPFSINTITNPYWINTLWSYLYNWHGQQRYGYIPSFHGRDQIGQLGGLPDVSPETKYFYLIIEPNPGTYQSLIDDSIAYENSFSQVIDTKNFNGILVQKRQLTKPLEKINFVK